MKFELTTLEEYSDDALLAELRRVAEELGGQRLTIERFNDMARVHSTTLRYRFGSWRAALDRAGISESIAPRFQPLTRDDVLNAIRAFAAENPDTSVTRDTIAARLNVDANNITRRFGSWTSLLAEVGLQPVPLGRRHTDDECFENLLALWTHFGRQPHFDELKRPPSTVGPKAYVLRWGGWRAALSAFVRLVNSPDVAAANPLTIGQSPPAVSEPASSAAPPRSIGLALRFKILARDRFRCVACGASPANALNVELHVDHIVPWSRGGLNVEDNLRTLCSRCNLGKGAKLDDAQLAHPAERAQRDFDSDP